MPPWCVGISVAAMIITLRSRYSSGTTGGKPKAVATPKSVWRQTNCAPGPLATIAAASDRRTVSYMPLAHGADRGVAWFTLMAGGRMGITTEPGGSAAFMADVGELRPTFLLGMSCFWQNLHSQHLQRLQPLMEGALGERLSVAGGGGGGDGRTGETGAAAAAQHRSLARRLKQKSPAVWDDLLAHFRRTREVRAICSTHPSVIDRNLQGRGPPLIDYRCRVPASSGRSCADRASSWAVGL
jgi:hypothetical protein